MKKYIIIVLLALTACSTSYNNNDVVIYDKATFCEDVYISLDRVYNLTEFEQISEKLEQSVSNALSNSLMFNTSSPCNQLSMNISIMDYNEGSSVGRLLINSEPENTTTLSISGEIINNEKVVAVFNISKIYDTHGLFNIGASEYVFDHVARELVINLERKISR